MISQSVGERADAWWAGDFGCEGRELLLPQYRTLRANSPSMKIAQRLGFDEYGFSVYVRLSTAPPAPPRASQRLVAGFEDDVEGGFGGAADAAEAA